MWDLEDAAALLPLWVGMILVGAVLGGMYQVWLSDLVLQRDWKRQERLQAVWRVALFSGLFLGISTLILSLTMVAAVFSTLLLPMFGVIAIFLGFSAIFWIGVYIIFAPHGIISYRLNVVGAIRESFFVVRMNLLSVVGFLTVVLGVAWATGLVWELPPEGTWYLLLAVLGHGFVSSVLWTSSYAYFQGRRDWLAEWREAVLARTQGGEGDSQRPVA